MPNHYSHTIFKQYMDVILNEDAKKSLANEQAVSELEDALG